MLWLEELFMIWLRFQTWDICRLSACPITINHVQNSFYKIRDHWQQELLCYWWILAKLLLLSMIFCLSLCEGIMLFSFYLCICNLGLGYGLQFLEHYSIQAFPVDVPCGQNPYHSPFYSRLYIPRSSPACYTSFQGTI